MPPLPELLALSDTAATVLRDLGLLGLVALMFAENVFPPIPSEAVLPLAGYLVAQGDLTAPGILVASTLGSVAGSVFLYELARAGGVRSSCGTGGSCASARTSSTARRRGSRGAGPWSCSSDAASPACAAWSRCPRGCCGCRGRSTSR